MSKEFLAVKLLTPQKFSDKRGYFLETFRKTPWEGVDFVQDNFSCSKKGVLRGLHYQSSPGQAKLITCLVGKIWDVAVDLRTTAPTFGTWRSFVLDDLDHEQLFLPVGFAHGFCVLSEKAMVQYKVSSFYDPNTERVIRWNDPTLQIAWPIAEPLLSERDAASPFFHEIFDDSLDYRR